MTTEEIVEGEVTDVTPPTRAVSVVPQAAVQSSLIVGGTAGLALMSEEEFDRNLKALETLRARVDKVKLALMKEGVDYGVIPGTKKPALLKPGAETLLRTFGLADSYILERYVGDGEETPAYEIVATARIHIGDTSGPIIAEGKGTANTHETKHRYRGGAAKLCPNCGMTNVIKSRPPRTGWWCGTRDGGCGMAFEDDDARITSQPDGKAENADPWDLANTVTKMAKKRALVDGILTATGTSGVFTQDEDAPGHGSGAQNAPGGAGNGSAPSGATPSGNSAPDGPAGLQGVVEKEPDGIRHVKVQRLAGTEHAKLEVVFKVGNRKHTAMLLDDAANRALGLELRQGEIIRVVGGQVEEIIWQEGKPPKKELWGAVDVAVLREGAWVLGSTYVPSLPLEDPAGRGPETLPRGSGTDAEPDPSTTGGTTPPSTAGSTGSPSGASNGTTATPESSPPVIHRGAEDSQAGPFLVRLTQPITFTTSRGRSAAILRGALVDDTGEIVQAVLGDDPEGEVEAQLGSAEAPAFGDGSEVVMLGTWKSGWVILTAVGAPGTMG